MADEIIQNLFDAADVADVDDEFVAAAKLRADIGNPPGKRGSLGDAVNWEWLLSLDVENGASEIVILSADGDFESELIPGRLREFLLLEWQSRHVHCALRLEKSLAAWLQRDFPDIKLADEVEKVVAMEQLESSWDFRTTHKSIARLEDHEDFTDGEVARLIAASLANDQIHGFWATRTS